MSDTLNGAPGVPHHNDCPTSPYSPADQGRDDDLICAECKVVAWSSVASLQTNGRKTMRSLNATPVELVTSRCPICRMLAHIKPDSLDGQPCVVEAIHSNRALPGVEPCFVFLSLQPENESERFYLSQPSIAILKSNDQQLDFGPRLVQPESINYDMIKNFIHDCDCNHHKDCPGSVSTSTVVEGFQVIEIRTRTVVEAPRHCRYAALSYVWGRQTGEKALEEGLGSPPAAIEDALACCASLGLKFLWVDRFVSFSLFSTILRSSSAN